jgi:enoyl-CoA hydratase
MDPSVTAVIITGSGSSFSAGVDLFRLIKDGPEYARRFIPVLDEFLRAALTFPKPLVAAINGHAIAGGCILAAACDHRIMMEGNGRIGIPELAVGVPFPALPLQIMAARLADAALRDLVFSGRTVQIDEAKTLGLIDEKCPAGMLLDRATEVAQRLALIPAATFALTKEAFYAPVLERAGRLSDLNARVADAWMQQQTYNTIRVYLEKTVGKK